MKKSKIIAIIIFLFVFLVPFRMLYFTDEIVQGGKFIGMLMATIIGFFVAFGIGTNEPFDRKEKQDEQTTTVLSEMKKAA